MCVLGPQSTPAPWGELGELQSLEGMAGCWGGVAGCPRQGWQGAGRMTGCPRWGMSRCWGDDWVHRGAQGAALHVFGCITSTQVMVSSQQGRREEEGGCRVLGMGRLRQQVLGDHSEISPLPPCQHFKKTAGTTITPACTPSSQHPAPTRCCSAPEHPPLQNFTPSLPAHDGSR